MEEEMEGEKMFDVKLKIFMKKSFPSKQEI